MKGAEGKVRYSCGNRGNRAVYDYQWDVGISPVFSGCIIRAK